MADKVNTDELVGGDSLSSSASSQNDRDYFPGSDFAPPSEAGVKTRSGGAPATPKDQDNHASQQTDETSGGKDKISTSKLDEKDDCLLEAELAEISRIERETKMLKIKIKKQQAQEDLDRLLRQSQGEGARRKASVSDLHDAVDSIRAQNQEQPAQQKLSQVYSGPTMEQIRQDSYTHDTVDVLMKDVYNVPAFTNARPAQPSHTYPGQIGKPRLKQHPRGNSDQHGNQPISQSDQPPAQLFKWVSHVDRYGAEYKTLIEATPPPKQPPAPPKQRIVVQAQPGWSYDEHSGRMYRVRW